MSIKCAGSGWIGQDDGVIFIRASRAARLSTVGLAQFGDIDGLESG